MGMRAWWAVLRAELGYRWRSWLTLALLVAVVGGVVLGATAAGRRTASAFPRFDAQYGYDAFVYSYAPVSKQLSSLPEVKWAVAAVGPVNGPPRCACRHPLGENSIGVLELPTTQSLGRLGKLVSGRLPRAANEAMASFTFTQGEGIHIGSIVRVPFFAASQLAQYQDNTVGAPTGPTVAFRIVGIDAGEGDFPTVGTNAYSLTPSPAFGEVFNSRIALGYGAIVRLRHGGADLPRFDQDVAAFGAGVSDLAQLKTVTADAIHPQAVGWWVLALLAGLAGLAVVGQAMSRQSNVEAEEHRTLAAIGMGPTDLLWLGLGRALLIGLGGAAGAVLLAFFLSPIAPMGEARVAEPVTGLTFDGAVLGAGAGAIALAVVLLALWPAYRASRLVGVDRGGDRRPSQVVARLAATGAPPSTVIGVRRALDRGRGRESVPVGSALGGAVMAVAALCATAVFGASLTHLVASPALYGQDFRIWFSSFPGTSAALPVEAQLKADKAVDGVTYGLQGPVEINGVATHSIAGQAVEGPVLVSAASGRLPVRAGEVALGSKTFRQVHATLGSDVRMTFPLVGGGSRTIEARVVGTASFPPDFGVVGLGTGAYMSVDGFVAAQCPPGPGFSACDATVTSSPVLLVRTVAGARGSAAVDRYATQYPGIALRTIKPNNLVNFGQAVNFPLILGVVLMAFGLATLLHVLVVSVARRRRELGLLKAIGLLRHQVVAAVCWQATTVAAVGLVVGVPVGIVVGRAVWRAFAVNIGVVPVDVIEVSTMAALAAGVLVVANLLALGPAFVSARERPSSLLRSE